MFDENLLSRALLRPAQAASDRALDEIMHLAQSANYDTAAKRAAELLDTGCKDIRAFIVYSLGVFAERGPAAVPALFAALVAVLSLPASDSPSSPQQLRSTDTALRFCFRIMKAHLDFEDRKKALPGQGFARYFQESMKAPLSGACKDLRRAIHALIESPRCEPEFAGLVAHFEAYASKFTAEPSAERAPPSDSRGAAGAALGSPSEEPPDSAPAPCSEPPPAFFRRVSDYQADVPALPVSPALLQFMRKLQAFEQLIESGSLAKAAIVAHDIRQVVANFDPVLYLPNLLSPHFRLLSSNIEQLSPYLEQSASQGWQAIEQLYRVDLDAFVEA